MNHPTNQAHLLTINQIANSLGVSHEAVRKTLLGTSASGVTILPNGSSARAWAFYSLPEQMRANLNARAREQGFDSVLDYINANRAPWAPPLPFSEILRPHQDKACSLQKALARTLNLTQGGPLGGEVLKQAIDDYKAAFGITVSADHIRRLYTRTVTRDRGLLQWHRVELFLDDAAFRKPRCKGSANGYRHAELDIVVDGIENKQDATSDERALLFDAAFARFEELCFHEPHRSRKIKASILGYLFSAVPSLSKSEAALRRMFDDKLKQWQDNGRTAQALTDKRILNSGRKRLDFAADIKVISELAVQLECNESRAQREAYTRGLLTAEYITHFKLDLRNYKSRIPHTIRQAATDKVIKMEPFLKGPRTVKLRAPRPRRDWSDCKPGDIFEADDCTFPVYFRAIDSKGIAVIVRGECLVFIDRRSRMILDFMLIAGRYTSADIRAGILKIHDKYGLPRAAFLFENGIWKARLIKGRGVQKEYSSWRQTQIGLQSYGVELSIIPSERGVEEAGVQVRNAKARNPQTKVIEQIFNSLQNRMAIEPGFTGRNERLDGYDRTQSIISQARKGHVPALDQLYTHAEWCRALEVIFYEYNQTPQNGEMLKGVAPAEMWREALSHSPLRKLPSNARFLLASHKSKVTPRKDGSIQLEICGNRKTFFSRETGELPRNSPVLVWWHTEFPDLITITDLKMQNPFTVREQALPSMSATREQFETVRQSQKECMEPGRVLFSNMRTNCINTITRDNEYPPAVRALGEFNERAIADAKAEDKAAASTRKRLNHRAQKLGFDISNARNDAMAATTLELLEIAEREANAKHNKI